MKTDKEYPATHSMSTAWYIVDDEGNVGILDYNENGPVPWGVEETCGDDLKYGHWEDWRNNKMLRFNLRNEQILDMLQDPVNPSEQTLWYDCVVRIDKEKTSRFLELCKNKDISSENNFCISEDLGLYQFDAFPCTHDKNYNDTPVHGTLKTMLEENIILEVYELQRFDMDDNYHNGKIVHTRSFEKSPYYMFHQPYWTEELPKKMNVPEHPVTIDQIPEEFRYRIHKIPGNFKDMDTFQIAQFYPCDAYSNEDPTYVVDGCTYQTSPLPDGSKVYTKIDMCDYSFFDFCSEKDTYHCENKCNTSCCRIGDIHLTDRPTVLILFDPKEEARFMWENIPDYIYRRSYVTSYLPMFPYREGQTGWVSKRDMEKYMNKARLLKLFKGSKGYFEQVIKDVNPRVILATDKAFRIVADCYDFTSDTITINGLQYPCYKMSCIKDNISEIDRLSQMSFQGKYHPHIITLEEMENLVKTGRAKEYRNFI